ncbi:unnamed protein product [Leptidea sinapis]|uniref:Uncharacterized protein n=1 Tax=Leptidea sinapis TaxID=189913 RepID=A0A5E4QCZ6_9NEOP|nr:unnamed protein product [Leptidea sinapis]
MEALLTTQEQIMSAMETLRINFKKDGPERSQAGTHVVDTDLSMERVMLHIRCSVYSMTISLNNIN